ncbi:uncharacterized protein LOC120185532 [Hibiscus syriacus]|uniref:uncharacterized protein LOC120185532 n=1 Tax=Hibiscus syriacus TaxID=106335 RepID=UPI001921B091|nr:uncharacterized protein LOC120185532 [Hibiscus syriacus]
MPPRLRKHESGHEKRQKRKRLEELIKSQSGALNKFIQREPQVFSRDQNVVNDHVNDVDVHGEDVDDANNANVDDGDIDGEGADDVNNDHVDVNHVDIFDPRRWDDLSSDMIKVLVLEGPKRDMKGLAKGQLANDGFADWQHLSTRLKEHEVGLEHVTNMATWLDMRQRLKKNETIDKVAQEQFEKERDHWKKVLQRIISIVKFLAKHNLAFRISNETLYQKSNGNFLGLIEMLEEFDPFIKEHGLFDTTQDELKSLGLDIDDMRGQGYDNGSNMKGLTLKSLSTTRWESRVDSVKAIRFQIVEVREALLQVTENDNDSKIKSEAKSLATNELGDFEFLVSIVIWFDILYTVNLVSKNLQSKDMLIDVAIKEVKGLIFFFEEFRNTEFSKAVDIAKQIATEMDVDPIFPQRRAIASLTTSHLEDALKKNGRSDIDANELYVELRLLNNFLPAENMRSTDVLKFMKKVDCFPNALIAFRVLLTIPVTVASAERSFSKMKLLKSYLRSTMSQERLNGLALIAIENDLLESLDYKELVNNFASKNARRTNLFRE